MLGFKTFLSVFSLISLGEWRAKKSQTPFAKLAVGFRVNTESEDLIRLYVVRKNLLHVPSYFYMYVHTTTSTGSIARKRMYIPKHPMAAGYVSVEMFR